MPEQIAYPRLRELLDAGAQLVEVLPEPEHIRPATARRRMVALAGSSHVLSRQT